MIVWLMRGLLVTAMATTFFLVLQMLITGGEIVWSRLQTKWNVLDHWYQPATPAAVTSVTHKPFQPRLTRWEQAMKMLRAAWPSMICVIAGLVMVLHAPLIALYLFAISALLYRLERRLQIAAFNQEAIRAIEDLLRRFQHGYRAYAVIFPVLEDLLRQGKLRSEIAPLVEDVLNRYHKGASDEQALRLLQGYNTYLDSFALVLRQAAHAPTDAVNEAIDEVRQRLRKYVSFQQRAQVQLAMVRMEFNVMKGAFLAVLLACTLSPLLRDFYVITLDRQLLFIGIATLGIVGIVYFSQEIYILQTQMLT